MKEDQNFVTSNSKTNKDLDCFFENDDTQTNIDGYDGEKESINPTQDRRFQLRGMDPLPLLKGNHSLAPDMKFGWKPEVSIAVPPIPLYFDFLGHPYDEFRIEDTIIYNGFRPKTSFQMHEEYRSFKYEGVYEKLLKFCGGEDDRDFVGMNPISLHSQFTFDSKFEGGNLDLVVKLYDKNNYYMCYLRPDSNSNGNTHWFYFSVSNRYKDQSITLNINNMTKFNGLYDQGFKPSIFSLQKYNHKKVKWHRITKDVVYKKVIRKGRIFNTCEFEYEFEYDNDIVWFATSIPYTYSMLLKYIKSIEDNVILKAKEYEDKIVSDYQGKFTKIVSKVSEIKKICEIKSIGKTLSGLNIPLIEITDYNCSKDELDKRKMVVVCGRVHPGETNASWITHGILDYLLGNSQIAKGLRKRIIFQIIPMINPDGVVLGNHRCSLLGRDINRSFEHPNSKLEPESYSLRKHLKEIQKEAFQLGK